MFKNFNIGLLGHVDSGKTSLAKALSEIASTAAFDKNPQSKARKITLDLGFSATILEPTESLKADMPELKQLQLTFVDCPGHSSLIRTIIGGAQIIDLMVLVIDAQKGIQTQTAECIVIGELLRRQLIVAVNKTDMLEDSTKVKYLEKLHMKLRKVLAKTKFGSEVPIINISAQNGLNIEELLNCICCQLKAPQRNDNGPFVMYVDHCFSIKGQGTICTGTIIQGQININDMIEMPAIGEQRKVKSMQIFRRPVQCAAMGDRCGLCVTQFNAKLLERGILTKPGYLRPIYAVCVNIHRIPYYKLTIKSKTKLHISVGHETVMANIILFQNAENNVMTAFDITKEYEYVEELPSIDDDVSLSVAENRIWALLEFESVIWSPPNATFIASKLDMDAQSNHCRLAFWGEIHWQTDNKEYCSEILPNIRIFKNKMKQGNVQRLVNDNEIIVQNLFKRESNRDVYLGKNVELSTGEIGVIESTFGQTTKIRIAFRKGLKDETLDLLRFGKFNDVLVILKYKKFIFNKKLGLSQ